MKNILAASLLLCAAQANAQLVFLGDSVSGYFLPTDDTNPVISNAFIRNAEPIFSDESNAAQSSFFPWEISSSITPISSTLNIDFTSTFIVGRGSRLESYTLLIDDINVGAGYEITGLTTNVGDIPVLSTSFTEDSLTVITDEFIFPTGGGDLSTSFGIQISAVPEPSAYALIAGALTLSIATLRRQRRVIS